MVQELSSVPSIGGSFGKGLGRGLSEHIPKEVERYRLAQGLQQFEQDSANLSPMQALARLSSIPGITPQMVQSFGELAKTQNFRNIYKNMGAGGAQGQESPNEIRTRKQGESAQPLQAIQFGGEKLNKGQQQNIENQRPQAPGQPQIVNENPTRPQAQVALPWTEQRRNQERARVANYLGDAATKEMIDQEVAANEARDLARPEAERARDERKQEIQNAVQNKFRNALETKFQKTGSGIYNDVIGENLYSLQRGLEKDLVEHPEKSVDDVIDSWSTKALDLAKAKNQLKGVAADNLWAFPIISDKQAFRNKLDQYGKIYKDSGNSEEYWKTLQNEFKMSPQGAATQAYPIDQNKSLNNYINSLKPPKQFNPNLSESNSRKYASKIGKMLGDEDSLLSIAWNLRFKDPSFDQSAFFDQLKNDQDDLGLNQRQRREIAEGKSDILPSWGDVLILPFFRGL